MIKFSNKINHKQIYLIQFISIINMFMIIAWIIFIYIIWIGFAYSKALSINESMKIMKIIKNNDIKLLIYKLNHGMNPNACIYNRTRTNLKKYGSYSSDILGVLLISYACADGTSDMVKYLIDHGANVNNPDGDLAPLSYAVSSLNISMIKMLLVHGAKVNQKDSNKETPLMILANYCHPSSLKLNIKVTNICKLLLKYKATVNDVNFQGETALSKFIDISDHDSNYQIVQLLIKNHANPNINDIYGRTLIQAAIFGNNPKITAYLSKVLKHK